MLNPPRLNVHFVFFRFCLRLDPISPILHHSANAINSFHQNLVVLVRECARGCVTRREPLPYQFRNVVNT